MSKTALSAGLALGLVMQGALMVASSLPAVAEDRPEVDKDRYALAPAGEIFLRLDRSSGRVSECRKANGTWRCEPVPDAQLALEGEIARLSDKLAALQQENAGLRKRLGIARPGDTARPGESVPKSDALPREGDSPSGQTLTPDEEQDLDRAMDFTEKAMRRFFGMMKTLRQEYDGLRN